MPSRSRTKWLQLKFKQNFSVQINGKRHVLVNIYVPCDSMTSAENWTALLNPLLEISSRVIISGDFNARSPTWGDSGYNANGKALEAALPSLKGVIFNNDGPTRIAERAGDSDSCVDLTITSAASMLEISWKLLQTCIDHY